MRNGKKKRSRKQQVFARRASLIRRVRELEHAAIEADEDLRSDGHPTREEDYTYWCKVLLGMDLDDLVFLHECPRLPGTLVDMPEFKRALQTVVTEKSLGL